MTKCIADFLGKSTSGKKSSIPALQDRCQSISGLILALFMLCHMIFTGTILFGKGGYEMMLHLAEPGGAYYITNILAGILFVIFMVHAFLGMRKFPQNYKAYLAFKAHKKRMKHSDTSYWWIQFWTGFFLFFFAGAHLLTITWGPKLSADLSIARFHQFHIFYFILLVIVVLHACIGMYRLCMKWISIEGVGKTSNEKRKDAIAKRRKIKKVVFLVWAIFFAFSILADLRWLSFA